MQQKQTGNWFWVEYDKFIVGDEETGYLLTVDKFSGNTGDMLFYNSGKKFTTFDRDNDNYINPRYNNSCAMLTHSGFWYPKCGYTFPNGAAPYFYYLGLSNGIANLERCNMKLLCL